MSEPNVEHRIEFSVEVPGTPDAVWDAIATAHGISAWMLPTDMDEREGGAVYFHMGEDAGSPGTVTGWEPPRRLVYEEPEWAKLGGHEGAETTPLVSEFLVEAKSGGTCVVTVVSSAFGTGADWEDEFFESMMKGWMPVFENLRVYLTHFTGQHGNSIMVMKIVDERPGAVFRQALDEFHAERVGQQVTTADASGVVEQLEEQRLLLRLTDPVPGMLSVFVDGDPERSEAMVGITGYYFSDDGAVHAEKETARWQAWVDQWPEHTP